MATSEHTATSPPAQGSTSALTDLSSLLDSLNIKQSDSNDTDLPADQTFQPAKPLIIYTPAQLLKLHKSFLVQPPVDMPDLKSWFGNLELEQPPSRKDPDTSQQTNSRDRRLRRDPDNDTDAASRPSFRTALSQPSQMGNFKHQSTRTADRDRDRDRELDKDREREGQERLRTLSDKYDRDRLAHPGGTRNKDREGAPHLASNRLNNNTNGVASRRNEAREAGKKKPGEMSEDWRREPAGRTGREEGRRDRDDRERQRSRVRETSRSRRDPSPSRKEDRDRPRRGEREDQRKEKERERDESEHDDSRKWRDDGKRDERMALRRDRLAGEDKDRSRDKPPHDPAYDDRRWNGADSDGRQKRGTARDRRTGADEPRERDDRRDREREKEPAWMDSHEAPSGGLGILGGRAADGALDGIQAWKKGMKEKEEREKAQQQAKSDSAPAQASSTPASAPTVDASGKPLDEIQLFKMLMKREESKKSDAPGSEQTAAVSPKPPSDPAISFLQKQTTPLPASEPTARGAIPSNPTSLQPAPATLSSANPTAIAAQSEQAADIITLAASPSALTYNPAPGPRLLSLRGSTLSSNSSSTLHPSNAVPSPNGLPAPGMMTLSTPSSMNHSIISEAGGASIPGMDRPTPQSFSPFEERASYGFDERIASDPRGAANYGNPGSRMAKYFEGKSRDVPVAGKGPGPALSPHHAMRQDAPMLNSGPAGERTIDDLYAMLNSSNAAQSGGINLMGSPAGINLRQAQGYPSSLQTQHPHQQQLHAQQGFTGPSARAEPLYDSRLEERSFVPDGMVPGLRSMPPPRNRRADFENMEDPYVAQQLLLLQQQQQQQQRQQQQRGMGPQFNPMYNQQQMGVLRNGPIPVQAPGQYRGGSSPVSNPNILVNPQQRVPPGLANLGGRPPHEPSHFLGMSPGGLGQGSPSSLQQHQQHQQNYGHMAGNGLGYVPNNASNALRNQLLSQQQQQSLVNSNVHPGMGHPSAMDPRLANASYGAVRGGGQAGFPSQQHLLGQSSGGGYGGRQQPQSLAQMQQIPQHLHSQHLPQQHHQQQQQQQQQYIDPPSNQPSQDLMALLMGGPSRD